MDWLRVFEVPVPIFFQPFSIHLLFLTHLSST